MSEESIIKRFDQRADEEKVKKVLKNSQNLALPKGIPIIGQQKPSPRVPLPHQKPDPLSTATGPIEIKLHRNHEKGALTIAFSKQVMSFTLPAKDAMDFGKTIVKQAKKLIRKTRN